MEHVVSQLISKRAELDGELKHLQGKIEEIIYKIEAVDTSIKIFDPNISRSEIKTKKFIDKSKYFEYWEISRIVLKVVKMARKALTAKEITIEVMKLKELDYNGSEVYSDIENRIRGSLCKNGLTSEYSLVQVPYFQQDTYLNFI